MPSLPKLKLVKFNENKHLPKTAEEKLSDDFFILLTAFIGENNGLQVNRLNLQKAIFLTKLVLHQKGIKFFNTNFYKYTFGPFQKRIHYSAQRLAKYSLIEKEDDAGDNIKLTNEGVNFLLFTLEKLPQDEAFKEYLDITRKFLQEYSGNKAGKSIDLTHSMEVQTEKGVIKVDDLASSEEYYLEPDTQVKYTATIMAPQEAIGNLANYRAYSLGL